jgi:hypothetical protein
MAGGITGQACTGQRRKVAQRSTASPADFIEAPGSVLGGNDSKGKGVGGQQARLKKAA